MDVFLATLSLIFSHNATALLPRIMNRLAQKSIHSDFTFVIKQPLRARTEVLFNFLQFFSDVGGEGLESRGKLITFVVSL